MSCAASVPLLRAEWFWTIAGFYLVLLIGGGGVEGEAAENVTSDV